MSTTSSTKKAPKAPKVRVTKGKLAQDLKVGDVILHTFTRHNGTPTVSLDTVVEITRNEIGEEHMELIAKWSYGTDRTGTTHHRLRRFDYITVL